MELTISRIMSPDFIKSFKRLSMIEDMEAKQKFQIVKMRRALHETIEDTREALKGKEPNDQESLINETLTFDFDTIELSEGAIAQLTADDIFNLEPIIKEI